MGRDRTALIGILGTSIIFLFSWGGKLFAALALTDQQPPCMSTTEVELTQAPGPQAADAPSGVPKRELGNESIPVLTTATAIAVVVLVEMTWIAFLGGMAVKIVERFAGG
jgi:hypothetical protein